MHLLKRIWPFIMAAALVATAIPLMLTPARAAINHVIYRMDSMPTVDGAISQDEWGDPLITFSHDRPGYDTTMSVTEDGGEVLPLAASAYLRYDDTHVYIAVVAAYEDHVNTRTGREIWRDDALQIQLSTRPATGERHSFGFALNSQDGKSRYYSSSLDVEDVEGGIGKDFHITRYAATQTTIYEMALPLSLFPGGATQLQDGNHIAFSFALHTRTGCYYEWAAGIVGEKNINLAGQFALGGVEPDPNATTTTATTTSTTSTTATSPTTSPDIVYLTGDVDDKGSVDSTDARLVLQREVGLIVFDARQELVGDVDDSKMVDSTDARLILQFEVGLITQFPRGNTIIIPGNTQTTERTTTTMPTTTTTQPPDPPDPPPLESNSFSPLSEKAGQPFADIDQITYLRPPVLSATKQFGYVAFTTELNPQLPFNIQCFVDNQQRVTAMVPAGVSTVELTPTFDFLGDKVTVNGQSLVSGVTTLVNLHEGVELTLHAKDGTTRSGSIHIEPLITGLPSMALTTDDYVDIWDKNTDRPVTFYVGGGTTDYATNKIILEAGTAHGRGNTSWGHAKKGYNVRLTNKIKPFGLGNHREWSLIANYEDKSLLRNYLGMYLAERAGIDYVMQIRPVDFWYNGRYWGTYNLTEKVEIDDSRVNITDWFDGANPGEVGYLMEFDGHVNEVSQERRDSWTRIGPAFYDGVTDEVFFQLEVTGKWCTIKKPIPTRLTAAHVQYVYDKVHEALYAIYNGDWETTNRVMDVTGFARWYLIEEWMNNTDSSMHSSVYMTLDVGGKFKLGPVWDFDRSSGNCNYWNTNNDPSALYNSGAGWFRYLFQMPQARTILKAEWAKLKTNTTDMDVQIEAWADMIYDSQKLNFERWDILGIGVGANPSAVVNAQTFEAQVSLLRRFMRDHRTRLDNFYKTI